MEESGGGNHFIFQETDQLVEDLRLDWSMRKPYTIGKSKINKKASTSVISGKLLG